LSDEIADIEGRNTGAPHRVAHVEIRLETSQSCLTLVSACFALQVWGELNLHWRR
jgi:hypothetical protein